MRIFYAQNNELAPAGTVYRNPGFYAGPEAGATAVYLDADYPQIAADYLAADVAVTRIDNLAPTYAPANAEAAQAVIAIPGDWRDLPWSQPDDRGLTLRGVASSVSSEPIRSKAEAEAAIEAYLSGEIDRPQPDADGLTIRELNADLEAAGLEVIPGEDPAATAARLAKAED